jgi:hypothetical protein
VTPPTAVRARLFAQKQQQRVNGWTGEKNAQTANALICLSNHGPKNAELP